MTSEQVAEHCRGVGRELGKFTDADWCLIFVRRGEEMVASYCHSNGDPRHEREAREVVDAVNKAVAPSAEVIHV